MLRTIIFKKIAEDPNLDKRILETTTILAGDPENIKALEELGAIYYYQKKNRDAIEIYEKLVVLEPANATVKSFLGYLYYEDDQLEKAVKILNESLDINASEPFVYFILGNVHARGGHIKEAVDCYDLAIFLDFDIYNAHIDFAKKYEGMGRIEKALKEYKTAYSIDPRNSDIKNKIEELTSKR